MKAFEKLLVPVDFAGHSAEAVRRACDVALHYSAAITLVHVHEPVEHILPEGYVLYSTDQLGRLNAELESRLQTARQDVLAQGIRHVDVRLLHGSASVEIVELAQSESFDLIVMGTHGRTGLRHVLMGSVAERVLRNAHCPVLTVKLAPTAAA